MNRAYSKKSGWTFCALDAGFLPSFGGERRMLRLAASVADEASMSLGEAVTGIDDHNIDRLLTRSATRPDDASSLVSEGEGHIKVVIAGR